MTRTLELELRRLRDGMPRLLPMDRELPVRGVVKTVAEWVTDLDGRVKRKEAIRAAENAVAVLRHQDVAQRKADRELLSGLHAMIRLEFEIGHPPLKTLGIRLSPGRPRGSKAPAVVQAAASAQMVATKKRRGILGTRQRARIPPAGAITVVLLGPDGAELSRSTPKRRR